MPKNIVISNENELERLRVEFLKDGGGSFISEPILTEP